eukprot:scaffold6899_cov183-Amphora_coffeaeformis.AAC.41
MNRSILFLLAFLILATTCSADHAMLRQGRLLVMNKLDEIEQQEAQDQAKADALEQKAKEARAQVDKDKKIEHTLKKALWAKKAGKVPKYDHLKLRRGRF